MGLDTMGRMELIARIGELEEALAQNKDALGEALAQNAMLREALKQVRSQNMTVEMGRALALPSLSADWLRKHDAEVLEWAIQQCSIGDHMVVRKIRRRIKELEKGVNHGDVADMILDGTLCQHCGTYLGKPEGYPKTCHSCRVEGSIASNAKSPKFKIRCDTCKKMVKRIGLKDHMRDAHGKLEEQK